MRQQLARTTATLASLLLLAGCSVEGAAQSSSTPSASDAESVTPELDADVDGYELEATETQEPEPTATAAACDENLQLDIEGSIRSQTEAFAAEDFQLAYYFSSPSFQANVDLQAFISVISSSYGPLLSSSQLQFSNCYAGQDQSIGVIDVRFIEGGNALYALRYFMVLTAEGWRVEGAGDLELVASGS